MTVHSNEMRDTRVWGALLGVAVLACASGACSGAKSVVVSDPSGGSGGGLGDILARGGAGGDLLGRGGAGGDILGPAGSGGGAGVTGGVSRPCVNLECQQTTCVLGSCQQPTCAGGAKTTVSGTVTDPAGKVPLYNVMVYVPNAPLADIATGVSCDTCDYPVSGSPIASALTDAKGEFVLENAPAGTPFPLVIQIGKWRRQIEVPAVTACQDTRVADKDLTRLPRNQAEGHIPKIAVTTGEADVFECLLRRMGIQDSEFTPESGAGRVNLYASNGGTNAYEPTLNGGAAFTPAKDFWGSVDNLKKYDMVILSCEGMAWEFKDEKPPAARQALFDYAKLGGRVFASHWHNIWIELGPEPFPTVATFNHQPDLEDPFTAILDTSFPKGEAFSHWLVNVGASTTPGELVIREAQHTVDAVNPATSRRWIYSTNPPSVQYFTFNTPIGGQPQCGRVVFTDIHVSSGDNLGPSVPFPGRCKAEELSPQEKALMFMLFDLSACVQDDKETPRAPRIVL